MLEIALGLQMYVRGRRYTLSELFICLRARLYENTCNLFFDDMYYISWLMLRTGACVLLYILRKLFAFLN